MPVVETPVATLEEYQAAITRLDDEDKNDKRQSLTKLTLGGIATGLVLVAFFAWSFFGYCSWGWVSGALGVFGLCVDIFGVIMLGLDSMDLAEKVVMWRPTGRAYWAGDQIEELNNDIKRRIQRREEIRTMWKVTRRGLLTIFLGFMFQAAGSTISFGNSLNSPAGHSSSSTNSSH